MSGSLGNTPASQYIVVHGQRARCRILVVELETASISELIEAYASMPHGSVLVRMFEGASCDPVVLTPSYCPEAVGGHVSPVCRKLIAEHIGEVFLHEAEDARFAATWIHLPIT